MLSVFSQLLLYAILSVWISEGLLCHVLSKVMMVTVMEERNAFHLTMPRKDAPPPGPISAQAQQSLVSDGIDKYELPKSIVTRIAKSAVRLCEYINLVVLSNSRLRRMTDT